LIKEEKGKPTRCRNCTLYIPQRDIFVAMCVTGNGCLNVTTAFINLEIVVLQNETVLG